MWIEKDTPEPFDQQPIDGLFYLDGDVVGRRFNRNWMDGYKLPMIAFPSGDSFELWISGNDQEYTAVIHIFGEMNLPLFDQRDNAYEYAVSISSQCGYLAEKIGEYLIEVWGCDTSEHYRITYDNDQGHMIDVE